MSAELAEGRAARGVDPGAEQDVDLGRYLRLLGRRWWVVAAASVLGAVVGFAVVIGHGQTYVATATLYLGLPYGASGDIALQSAQTNPSTLAQIVHSFSVDERVARACKAPAASFSNGISTQQIAGSLLKNRQNTYLTVSVLARKPILDQCAANGLARAAVAILAPYANAKIAAYRREIANDDQTIRQVGATLKGNVLSSIDRLVLEVQLPGLQSDRARVTLLLAQVIRVEEPRQIGHARAARVTARTPRSSTLVAGLIGMILGVIVVLVWDARTRRGKQSSVAR
jgi:hypothetical protein